MGNEMTNTDILALLTEIEAAIRSGKFKPTVAEKGFILSCGSICRTPQRLSARQSEWIQQIYRISQGAYQKRYSRIERVR